MAAKLKKDAFKATARWMLCAAAVSSGAANAQVSDLWWNPARPGRAISVEDQFNVRFAILFDYTAEGRPTWLVAPAIWWDDATGDFGYVYRTTGGGPESATPGIATIARVGSIGFDFHSNPPDLTSDFTSVRYSVDGTDAVTRLSRFVYGSPSNCEFDWIPPFERASFQGLWWNPDEPGWAIHVSDQRTPLRGHTLFALLATYAADGESTWLMSLLEEIDGSVVSDYGDRSFAGNLQRTHASGSGSAAQETIGVAEVGKLELSFWTGTSGQLKYRVDGMPVSKTIQRYSFGIETRICWN